ncbi:hypothetical protein JKP88DRAFT_221188, partial [Tribonema minus]
MAVPSRSAARGVPAGMDWSCWGHRDITRPMASMLSLAPTAVRAGGELPYGLACASQGQRRRCPAKSAREVFGSGARALHRRVPRWWKVSGGRHVGGMADGAGCRAGRGGRGMRIRVPGDLRTCSRWGGEVDKVRRGLALYASAQAVSGRCEHALRHSYSTAMI